MTGRRPLWRVREIGGPEMPINDSLPKIVAFLTVPSGTVQGAYNPIGTGFFIGYPTESVLATPVDREEEEQTGKKEPRGWH